MEGIVCCAVHRETPLKYSKISGKATNCPSCDRNREARLKNMVLRELCGTSAKAAKEDMGL